MTGPASWSVFLLSSSAIVDCLTLSPSHLPLSLPLLFSPPFSLAPFSPPSSPPSLPPSQELYAHVTDPNTQWTIPPLLEELKEKAQQAGLWNLFLPGVSGFTQLEYAPMAEEMGRCPFASEVS